MSHHRPITRSSSPRQHASVYIMVLGLVLLMMAAGAASIAMSRARTRALSQANDIIRAEYLADSALELAMTLITTNAFWRLSYTSGTEGPQIAFGGGTMAFEIVDETDGMLSNNSTDSFRVYGIGRYGDATQVCSMAVAGTNALSCLNAPLVVNGDLNFNQSNINAGGATIATNGNMTDSASGTINTLTASLEAWGSINLTRHTVTGTQKSGIFSVTPRNVPGASAFDYYVGKGTTIPITSLPVDSVNGGRKIEKTVLSPATNPFTSTLDADGVYVIPCNGTRINILNCRIVGTLVLLNPGAGSCVGLTNGDGVNWSSAITNFPCLMVKGDFSIAFGNPSGILNESSISTNLNPAGTPYPYVGGTTNTTTTDTLTNAIDGLVYISGKLTDASIGSTYPRINMLVVGGTYDASNDNATVSYRDVYTNFPPPGFTGNGTLTPIAGTYRKELAP